VKRLALAVLAIAIAIAQPSAAQDAEKRRGFSIKIVAPAPDEFVVGRTKIQAEVKSEVPADVDRVEFLVKDKVIFVDREPPYECTHDFGEESKAWVIRAVLYHRDGFSVSDVVVTRKITIEAFEEVNRVILWVTVTDKSDKLVGDLPRGAGDHREHLGRQPGLVQDVGKRYRTQGRLFGWLQDHAVVRGDRRSHLVRNLVQRVVERRDRGDNPTQRPAQCVHLAPLAVRRQIAGEDLTVVGQRRIAGEHEYIAGTADLVERIFFADPALGGNQVRDFFAPAPDQLRGAITDPVAIVASQPGLEALGDGKGAPDVVDAGLGHGAHHGSGVWIHDLDYPLASDAIPGDAHFFVQHASGPDVAEIGHHVHGSVGFIGGD